MARKARRKQLISLPNKRGWQRKFYKVAVDFIEHDTIEDIVHAVMDESVKPTSDDMMYERAHRKLWDLIDKGEYYGR